MKHDRSLPLFAAQTNDGPTSPPSWLRKILDEHPEARPLIGRPVAALLGTALVALAALSALLIWHLIRRGRLIRERLGAPRVVRLPDLPATRAGGPPAAPESPRRETDVPS
jgi:hypothetical protein